ncbi:MAG: Fic family protein [Clostridiales Family XIII bacterium]|jgi:hypothetical protein|nr:Fic family protein [Clostridiales Family XIII bacterium]
MFRQIEEKKKTLLEGKPFSDELVRAFDALDLLDFAYTNLKLEGSSLTEQGVGHIIHGEIVHGVTIGDHNLLEYHRRVLKDFSHMKTMEIDLDARELLHLYSVLTDKEKPALRTRERVLYHLDYVAPMRMPVSGMLDELFRYLYRREDLYQGDYIRRAVELHDGIIGVYPFDEGSEMLARCAMQYELIRNGLPIVPLDMKEPEYNISVEVALKKGDHRPLYNSVCRGALQKLDKMLALLNA